MFCSPLKLAEKIFSAGFILLAALLFQGEAHAQYSFGRNKIQYNQFDWRVMQTEHFDIYFYKEMEDLANIGAKYAEDSYKILQAKFDQTVSRRIPLIFYSSHFHFQETNVTPSFLPEGVGGFFEFIKGRVVIPANGSMAQFQHVIRHELVHVFTYSKINRILKDNKKLNSANLPLWFTEGLAEYWSAGWDSDAEMFIRDAVLNNYLFPLKNIFQINGSFLMYKEGQSVCRFIAEKYGDDKLLQLFENFWKVDSFEKIMKLTVGKDYRELDDEWIYELKKKLYPLMQNRDMPGKVSVHLTQEGFNTQPAFYRQNGKPMVLFHSNRTGYSGIYKKEVKPYRKGENKAEIVIQGNRTPEFESFHLLQSKIDVSRSGLLCFVAKSGGQDAVFIYDLNKQQLRKKMKFKNLVYMSSPSWNRAATQIVFSAIDYSGRNDLYIVEPETEHLIRLTNDLFDDRDACWTPGDDALVFSSDRSEFGLQGAYNLFRLDLKSFDIRYLTHGRFKDYSPLFSPDGKYLVFSSDRDGAFNLWAISAGERYEFAPMQAEKGAEPECDFVPFLNKRKYFSVVADDSPERVIRYPELKEITRFVTGSFNPEWTDDGSLIFTAFENFGFQLREMSNVTAIFDSVRQKSRDRLAFKGPLWLQGKKYQNRGISSIHYKRKYSLDIAQSYVTQDPIFGTFGGAQLAVSDVLGNEQYYIMVYNNATTKEEFLDSFNVAVTKLDLSGRINFSYGLYHLAGRFYNYYDGFFYERRYGGFFGLSYPFSVFNRVEASVNVRNSNKEWFSSGYFRKALLISNFVSLVKDNSLWGPTGPLDGQRYNLTIGNTVDIQHSNVNFYTVIFDFRNYFRLSRRTTFATRWMTSLNLGKETIKFFMGGSWDLRGYKLWSIWGEKMVLFSQELRYPFIDKLAIRFPFGGIGFSSIRGAAFVDVGNAWNGPFERLLGSFGLGVRLNFGGFLVFRLDYGKKFDMDFDRSLFKPTSFTLHNRRFTQFFFGWDF
ncbi:MAG TPA: hypothetical protein ENH29_03075 [Bacteroidetes bacterium]|nr:hypothetical protein [Bacteroidota bacterium]